MKSNLKFFKSSKILPIDKFFKNVLYDRKFGIIILIIFEMKEILLLCQKFCPVLRIIAIWIISSWELFGKPKKFNIVDFGDGSLMKILLKSFKKFPEFNSIKKIFLYGKQKP